MANIGGPGQPATRHLEDLWIKDLTITTGLVDAFSTPAFLRLLQGHQLDADRFVTHHVTLDQFGQPTISSAIPPLKVFLSEN